MSVVTGMNTDDHTTRTLLMSQKVDGMLLVSRGSTSNIDPAAEVLSSGHSQIKAFNLNNITANGYSYDTDGLRLGYAHFGAVLPYFVPNLEPQDIVMETAPTPENFSLVHLSCLDQAMLTPRYV